MIRIEFTASRELTGYHVEGDLVTLKFSAAQVTPGREVSRSGQKAIGGRRETLHHYGLRTWSITTSVLQGADLDAVIEFIASVEGGEPFTIEPWRNESGPSLDLDFLTPRLRVAEAIEVTLVTEGWSLSELERTGTGGADDYYQLTLQVIEKP